MRDAPPVRVAALEWLDPSFVAGHWTPQLIEYAGGEDVLGLPGEHSEVRSWEEVAAAQPEVVVVMPCGYDAERALEEAYEFGDELAELGARRVVAVDAVGLLLAPRPAPDRRPRAARARAAPRPGAGGAGPGPRSDPLVRGVDALGVVGAVAAEHAEIVASCGFAVGGDETSWQTAPGNGVGEALPPYGSVQ